MKRDDPHDLSLGSIGLPNYDINCRLEIHYLIRSTNK